MTRRAAHVTALNVSEMADKPFPVANSTLPYWRTSPHALDNFRSSDTLPAKADIVIIGAGYAGASIVHHLLENEQFRLQQQSLVIIEAREACSGATGRNGATYLKSVSLIEV